MRPRCQKESRSTVNSDPVIGAMPYLESDLIPISALQHLLFCERQCALIHIERQWADNRLTTEGNHLHKKAHDGPDETRDGVRTTRGLRVHSFELGLVGQCDVVLWQPPDGWQRSSDWPDWNRALPWTFGIKAANFGGWTITPVEYKRGREKKNDCDRVQLAAQAMCLEEMLSVSIARGELFYGQKRRRVAVEFDIRLRGTVRSAAARLHDLVDSGITPPAVRLPKCDSCSLIYLCLPTVTQTGRSASRFVGRQFSAHLRAEAPASDPFDLCSEHMP